MVNIQEKSGIKYCIANIWDLHANGEWIVIPINTTISKVTQNLVMGAGLAKDARDMFVGIDSILAEALIKEEARYFIDGDNKVLYVPTKNDWRAKSPASLVRIGIKIVNTFSAKNNKTIYCPLLGCGNGGLQIKTFLNMWRIAKARDEAPNSIIVNPVNLGIYI